MLPCKRCLNYIRVKSDLFNALDPTTRCCFSSGLILCRDERCAHCNLTRSYEHIAYKVLNLLGARPMSHCISGLLKGLRFNRRWILQFKKQMTNALFWQSIKPYILIKRFRNGLLFQAFRIAMCTRVCVCKWLCVCAEGLERIFSDQ